MSEPDHVRVSEAVRVAEVGTSGEIVTIVADHSDRYLDIALWWSIGVVITMLTLFALFPQSYDGVAALATGGWIVETGFADGLRAALAVAVISFGIARLLMQFVPIRLFFTPGMVKASRVRRRAVRYFKAGAERRTVGRTGILIYLSLKERRAEIVADEAIHGVVAQEEWGKAMADMLEHVRQGRIADGMIAAINDVGVILAAHFPRADDDRNELPDRLIEL